MTASNAARSRWIAIAAVALVVASPAQAQQDAKVSREREALRRSQAALHQAQEQQAALAKDKSDLVAQKAMRDEELKQASTQLGSARGEAGRLKARLTHVEAELDALKASAATDRDTAAKNAATSAVRIERTDKLLAERTRTVATLVDLLERSTKALAAAEEANRKMYSFGRDMIEQYRQATPADPFLASESVLGFAAVRRENRAEELRTQLDANRVVATPR